MLTSSRWIFPLALCFICVSAYAQQHNETDCEPHRNTRETHKLSIVLGTSVLLPCNFSKNHRNTVSWVQTPEMNVVALSSDGRINFSDPRYGRVNAFPNQGSRGNYSISIDKVNSSDLGCYRCVMGDDCVQVELALYIETRSESFWLLYIYICSGFAAFILLSVGCILLFKNSCCLHRRTEENDTITGHEVFQGVSFPTEETGRVPGDGQQEGTNQNPVVYENDDDPEPDYLNELPQSHGVNRNEANQTGHFMRMESQRNQQRFHTELINRLRQASIRKHYYVNQDEIQKRRAPVSTRGAEKKVKTNCQYPNPIYNRSTDHLNQL